MKSVLKDKSYAFAIRIDLSKVIQQKKKEFVMNRQVVRSGTAIGDIIREAEFVQSNADYINKFSIALKETNETDYWLSPLKDTEIIDNEIFECLSNDCKEIISMLVATVKTLKSK